MNRIFHNIFLKYPQSQAPFLHRQYDQWFTEKPLRGLRILHHVPLFQNTLLKIAALIGAGADVVVTHPSFTKFCKLSQQMLAANNIKFVADLKLLRKERFDLFLDCGAELFQALPPPTIGAIELTGTGDQFYRQSKLDFPVISIDRSLTKQLETIFGTAVSALSALKKLTDNSIINKTWMIFGFGKIGRGLAYCCAKNKSHFTVVDTTEAAKIKSQQLGINYADFSNLGLIEHSLRKTDIVITATGQSGTISKFSKNWFEGKLLANMGILDEFGENYLAHEVLNHKQPINFILEDPTPIEYIDPELFAHNEMILHLLDSSLSNGIHDMPKAFDNRMIAEWCQYHSIIPDEIQNWFINF